MIGRIGHVNARANELLRPALIIIALLAGLFFFVDTLLPARRAVTHGFPGYYTASRLLIEGRWGPAAYDDNWFGDQVADLTGNRVREIITPNTPLVALVLVPLARLDMSVAREIWTWLNLLLFAGSLWLIGNALPAPASLTWRAGFVALALLYAPAREDFRLGQMYVLLLFLLSLAFWCLQRRSTAIAGLPLGIATVTKLSVVPLWLILAGRGDRRTLVIGALTMLGACALGIALTGWASWPRFIEAVIERVADYPAQAATAFQSTPGFFQHLFVREATWNPAPVWHQPWLAHLLTPFASVTTIGATLWRARRVDIDLVLASGLALSVVLLPLAEEHHYTLLLIPIGVVAARITRTPLLRRDVLWLSAIILLLAVAWPYESPSLSTGWTALLAYPRLYGGWLLWAWLYVRMKTHG